MTANIKELEISEIQNQRQVVRGCRAFGPCPVRLTYVISCYIILDMKRSAGSNQPTEKPFRAAIYVRVSTSDQNPNVQETELREYAKRRGLAVHNVYVDKGQSGAKVNRPALDDLMADCKRRKVDVVLVWKFDRFARSLRHLIEALEEFSARGIEFVSATEQIDTTTPSGRCFFQIIGAIAEFERSLISERVKAGLAHARQGGKRLGRPPIRQLSPKEAERARKDRENEKLSLRALARKYRITLWAAHRLCADRGAQV